jgi:hypothetical protein
MGNDPTEDVIKREIAAAAKILREDGHAVRLSAIEAKLDKHFPDEPEGDDDPNGPKKPDKKPEPSPSGTKPRGGIWWGESVSNGDE